MGRPPTCICGECAKCKRRKAARERWRSLPIEERRAIIARRDPEKVRAADRARHERDREKRLAGMRRYRNDPANRPVLLAATQRWIERNPEKRAAQVAVGNAVRDGRLRREPCEVCGASAQAHHDDHLKPLDVRWLCPTHHAQYHGRLRRKVAA